MTDLAASHESLRSWEDELERGALMEELRRGSITKNDSMHAAPDAIFDDDLSVDSRKASDASNGSSWLPNAVTRLTCDIPPAEAFNVTVPPPPLQAATQTWTAKETHVTKGGGCNLRVASLPPTVDDAQLRELFEPFGKIESAIVLLCSGTAISRGFGFVLFEDAVAGEAAIAAMNGRVVQGHTLNVHRSLHDGRVVETNAVFARNLPFGITEYDVRAVFERTGKVTQVLLATDERPCAPAAAGPGKLPGRAGHMMRFTVATIEYEDVKHARDAIATFHGKPWPSGGKAHESTLIMVKFAEGTEARRNRLHQQQSDAWKRREWKKDAPQYATPGHLRPSGAPYGVPMPPYAPPGAAPMLLPMGAPMMVYQPGYAMPPPGMMYVPQPMMYVPAPQPHFRN